MQNMFMPYIEGPRMDWIVNDSLYHWFLKWRLKCKSILECKLTALPKPQKCKKVIAWSRDFGMDQYVSWDLTKEELKLDTIWAQFEEFCKPQSNEVWARFDLLTSFHQGSKSIDECHNSVQAQDKLAKYPPETAKILHRDLFCFFLHEEDFVSKTINEGTVDLDMFPASKLCQLAKKYESSKATARHIKQVAGELQAMQIHLMRHQQTELSNGKYNKQKSQAKPRPMQNKNVEQKQPNHYKKLFDPRSAHKQKERCSKCGDSTHLRRLSMPCEEIPVQRFSQIWALHKLVLHERSAEASIPQTPQTEGTSADCRYNTSIWQSNRIRTFRRFLLSPVAD